MDAMENILSRRSIRKYKDKPIEDEKIKQILTAAMSAPSCVNSRDWAFIAVTDKEMLNKMADVNGRPAEPLRGCAAAILVCGDLERAFEKAKDYWIIDCSIAAGNICLAANALGIGSVWLGTYPQKERVEGQSELFGLPESIVPHSIIALGYPDEVREERKEIYEESRVHFQKWQ